MMDLIAVARVALLRDADHPGYAALGAPGIQVRRCVLEQPAAGRQQSRTVCSCRCRALRRLRNLPAATQGLEALASLLADRHGFTHADGAFGAAVDLRLGHAPTVRAARAALRAAAAKHAAAAGARGRRAGGRGSGWGCRGGGSKAVPCVLLQQLAMRHAAAQGPWSPMLCDHPGARLQARAATTRWQAVQRRGRRTRRHSSWRAT